MTSRWGVYDDIVYRKAHDLLWQMVEEGSFVRDEKPCYYIYELTMEGRVQTGIVACASIDDYEKNVIKKHESTRAEKEADRVRHIDTCNAQTGPIFLAYRGQAAIDEVVERTKKGRPLYYFTADDGITHRVFLIEDEADIETIHSQFARLDSIYIADGHHRAASAVRVGQKRRKQHPGYTGEEEFNFFLSVLFPDHQLMIMPYNRVVKDLNGLSKESFYSRIARKFDVVKRQRTPLAPGKKGEFAMLVLVYRKCSTCQKALRWLEEHKIFFEERAIVEENPTYEELKEWYGRSGMPLKKFFNTSGMLYKQMNLKDKLPEMTEDEQLKLLATDGMLVKRPLVVGEDFVLTGFREKEWEEKIRG